MIAIRCRLFLVALILGAPQLWAQAPGEPRSFEAAVVNRSSGGIGFRMSGGPGTSEPGQITYSNVTLVDLILDAYDVRPYQIKGPSWLDSDRFDITAKVPSRTTREDAREMMRTLLAERFKLAVHRETLEGRNYSLVVDKGGPKLKPPTDGTASEHATFTMSAGSLQIADRLEGRPVALAGRGMVLLVSQNGVTILANSQPVSALAARLARLMDGPVHDATSLTTLYDFSLSFAPPPGMRVQPQIGPPGEITTLMPNMEPPLSIFQALKELGLKLDPGRGPVQLLVIDHAEKIPTSN